MTVHYASKNKNGFVTGKRFSIDEPAACVMANGIAGDQKTSVLIQDDGARPLPRPVPRDEKPPYRVPLMSEISRIRWNGLTVASLFAGAGGSSTGYRMAGYRVVWASEFVPIAQESYRANMRRGTILDGRDIRQVDPADILKAIKMKKFELDVLDGSPPCQAFSTAGIRDKGWGKDRKYAHGAEQKNEELFTEFIRVRDGLMPRAFIAENVSGLVKGKAKGFFLEILRELKRGYRVEARILDAQWLGVPQTRQRVIFVGVREDLGLDPAFPDPLPYRYSVRDALPWLGGAGVLSNSSYRETVRGAAGAPSPTIRATQTESIVVHDTGRKGQQPKDVTDRPCPTITAGPDDAGDGGGPRNHFRVEGVIHDQRGKRPKRRTSLDEPAPTITAGTHGSGPHDHQLIGSVEPETDISRYAIGEEYDRLNPGQKSDKYFSLVRASPDQPCPTVTAVTAHGLSGAGVVHPVEKRKFSIAELKQICSFPPDFILTGSFAQQWERLGNSVPPVMMKMVAEALRDRVFIPLMKAGTIPGRRGHCKDRQQNASGPKSEKARQTSAGFGRHRVSGAATDTSGIAANAALSRRTSSRSKKKSAADSNRE